MKDCQNDQQIMCMLLVTVVNEVCASCVGGVCIGGVRVLAALTGHAGRAGDR